MTNFKYFVHGTTAGQPVYGLYQAAMNRFLFVIDDLDRAHKLQALLVGRYPLAVCCLSAADNYQDNMVDNECCENWTLSNVADTFRSSNFDSAEVPVEQLLETYRPFDWPIAEEKQWIMLCNYWIDFFDLVRKHLSACHQFDAQVISFVDCELEYFPIQLEQQVMQLLFEGTDLDTTEQAVVDLISNSVLSFRLNHHVK